MSVQAYMIVFFPVCLKGRWSLLVEHNKCGLLFRIQVFVSLLPVGFGGK